MLYTTREHAHRELEVVERIGRASMTLDLEHLFRTMYEHVGQIVPAEVFYVALYDAERNTLAYDFLVDSGKRFPPQTMPVQAEWRAILGGGAPRVIHQTPRGLAAPHPRPRLGEGYRRRRTAGAGGRPLRHLSRRRTAGACERLRARPAPRVHRGSEARRAGAGDQPAV